MAVEKEEAKEGKEEKSKKSKLNMIIITGLVILLAVGGYYGYSKYKKSNKNKAEKEKQMSILIPLKSFVVNLFDEKGVGKRYLKINMELEVNSEEDRTKVENNIAQLSDTVLLFLSSQTLKEINTMEGKLELKNAIILRMNQILGNKTVRSIYFTEFVVQ